MIYETLSTIPGSADSHKESIRSRVHVYRFNSTESKSMTRTVASTVYIMMTQWIISDKHTVTMHDLFRSSIWNLILEARCPGICVHGLTKASKYHKSIFLDMSGY